MKVCSVCLRCFEDAISSCFEENHGALTQTRSGSCELIDGYRLEFLAASDETGETYQAVNLASNQKYSVRVVTADAVENNQESRARFLKESQIAAQINCPNVVRIFVSGTLPDKSLFVVSEFAGGQTLSERLKSGNPISEMSAVAIARQTAEALEAIHAAKITHRNINSENIILSAAGENDLTVKIKNIDFGEVRQQFIVSNISNSEFILSSLKYFSPEQCLGEKTIDSATDVYSLGVVLYEMLAGNTPFDAPDAAVIIDKQINEHVPSVQISNFDIRALLAHTLSLSLQKTVIARLKSANAFARQLRHIEQYALRSFSPAVSERILTDEREKNRSDNQNQRTTRQLEAIISLAEPTKSFCNHEQSGISKLIGSEEKIPVDKVEKTISVSSDVQENSAAINLKKSLSNNSQVVNDSIDAETVLSERVRRENFLPVENNIVKVSNGESHEGISAPQMITVEEAEKYLDDQVAGLLDLNEPESASNSFLETEEKAEDYEWDDRYRLPDIRQLISVQNNKMYLGGAAALVLLVLMAVIFSRLFSSNEKPALATNQPPTSKSKAADDLEIVSPPQTSEESPSGSETAVVEISDLPDSKTFGVEGDQPVPEKSIAINLKSVNQNPLLKESANSAKINPKKSPLITKEKTAAKTAAPQNAFPDVKIVIGNQKSISGKPDVFSRPRVVQKSKNLRVF